MTWKGEKQRHSMASRGIKSKSTERRLGSCGKRFIGIEIPPNMVKVYDKYSEQYEWFNKMQDHDTWMDFMEEMLEMGIHIHYDHISDTFKLANLSEEHVSYDERSMMGYYGDGTYKEFMSKGIHKSTHAWDSKYPWQANLGDIRASFKTKEEAEHWLEHEAPKYYICPVTFETKKHNRGD